MAIPESALGGGKFSTSGSTTVGNDVSTCNNPCVPGGDCSIVVRNSSKDNAYTSNPSSRGKRLGGKLNTLVEHAQRTGGSSRG
jgi:hypothetical protein